MASPFLPTANKVRGLSGTSRDDFWGWAQPVARSARKISWRIFVLVRNRYNSGSPLYFVRQGSGAVPDDAVQGGSVPKKISRQTFVLARNRYNSGSPLYFVRGGSEIIASDAVQGGSMPEILLIRRYILILERKYNELHKGGIAL